MIATGTGPQDSPGSGEINHAYLRSVYSKLQRDCLVPTVLGKPSCSIVELAGPIPEIGFQQDNLVVGSNSPGAFEMISRCRLDRKLFE